MLKLGIFEIGTTDHTDDLEIIDNTIELAKLADELGYSRFWLGEHHEPGVAWKSPEILMTVLAGYTNTIKIGAAGILLPLNSPLRVAQNFKMLGSLFSGRIDLGIARGFTSEHTANKLLNGIDHKLMVHDHLPRVKELLNYLKSNPVFLNENQKDYIMNVPVNGAMPEVWMLGSSGSTTAFAIREQLNFALSLLHSSNDNYTQLKEMFLEFIDQYQQSHQVKPVTNITVAVVCGEDKKQSDEILKQHLNNININISGSVEECAERIQTIHEDFKTDEILLQIFSPDFKHKCNMVEALAKTLHITDSVLK